MQLLQILLDFALLFAMAASWIPTGTKSKTPYVCFNDTTILWQTNEIKGIIFIFPQNSKLICVGWKKT